MRLLSVALASMSMDRWQGSVGRPCGQDYRGGAGGVLGGNRHQVRAFYSHRSEDSARCGIICGIGSFSKCNRHNRNFDFDKLASAVLGGISSSLFGPVGSLYGGAVVARGHPGCIPGVSII